MCVGWGGAEKCANNGQKCCRSWRTLVRPRPVRRGRRRCPTRQCCGSVGWYRCRCRCGWEGGAGLTAHGDCGVRSTAMLQRPCCGGGLHRFRGMVGVGDRFPKVRCRGSLLLRYGGPKIPLLTNADVEKQIFAPGKDGGKSSEQLRRGGVPVGLPPRLTGTVHIAVFLVEPRGSAPVHPGNSVDDSTREARQANQKQGEMRREKPPADASRCRTACRGGWRTLAGACFTMPRARAWGGTPG